MSRHDFRTFVSMTAFAIVLIAGSDRTAAATKAKIEEAILKAQKFIILQNLSGPHGAIAALAYVKSGANKKADPIQRMALDVSVKVQSGAYLPTGHHNYEAGVDLMLLEAVDAEKYRPQMEAIVAYLLKNQQPNGAWFYDRMIEPDCGDTSITQY